MDEWDAISDLLKGRRVGRGRPGVAREGHCWVFLGGVNKDGYGLIRRASFAGFVHRYIWTVMVGPIPEGLQVLHHCDNPCCVRPAHLWLGTQRQNIHDMVRKGRDVFDHNSRKTHCKRGHLFDEENTRWQTATPSGVPWRRCRACEKLR